MHQMWVHKGFKKLMKLTDWDDNAPTNVDQFLEMYKENDNVFWYVSQGHIQNVLDELINRLNEKDD